MRERGRDAADDARVSWASLQRHQPALAQAARGFSSPAGSPCPTGHRTARAIASHRRSRIALVLLEDYALRCLRNQSSADADARYDAIAAALRDLGFNLTRRASGGDDRTSIGWLNRLTWRNRSRSWRCSAIEYDARSEGLACTGPDRQRARQAVASDDLVGVLRPGAGTPSRRCARGRRSAHRRCTAARVRARTAAPPTDGRPAARRAGEGRRGPRAADWRAERDEDDLVQLPSRGAAWRRACGWRWRLSCSRPASRRTLVGTRALPGEGWDAPVRGLPRRPHGRRDLGLGAPDARAFLRLDRSTAEDRLHLGHRVRRAAAHTRRRGLPAVRPKAPAVFAPSEDVPSRPGPGTCIRRSVPSRHRPPPSSTRSTAR